MPMTVVVAVALLLSGFGSVSFPLTVAVLVSVPGVVVVTTIVTLALVPFARSPRLQLIVPPFGAGLLVVDRVQGPWLEATESKWALKAPDASRATTIDWAGEPLAVLPG